MVDAGTRPHAGPEAVCEAPPMRDLTLRQVEVIRAVLMTGTIQGAAEFLNVSAPGISRLVKHTEESLGVRLFERKGGLFVPAPEAAPVFEQVHQIHEKMAGLSFALDRLKRGAESELAFAAMPSIAQFIAARAAMQVRRRFPELYIDLNVLKIEETVDYLLLERGEFVAASYRFDHPSLDFRQVGAGELVVILPEDHRLAGAARLAVREIADEPLIGVDASDPYGEITSRPVRRRRAAAPALGQGPLRPDRGQPRAPRPRGRDHRRVLGRRRRHARPRAGAPRRARRDRDPRRPQGRPNPLQPRRLRRRPHPRRAAPGGGGAALAAD